MFYLTKPPGKDPQEKEGKDNGKKADETKPKNKKEYKTFDGNLSQVLYLHLQLRFNPFRKRVKIFVLFVASRKLQSSTTSSQDAKKLKKMRHSEVKTFYNEHNCKCMVCFNKIHSVGSCNLPKRECSNVIVKAFKDKKGCWKER